MELEIAKYYEKAAQRAKDAELRQLLGDSGRRGAQARRDDVHVRSVPPPRERAGRGSTDLRQALPAAGGLQPGLAGLMDGSVSTLAPLFASAFATRSGWNAFLVGMAAAVGPGISMGFAEALSDDGSLTGTAGARSCAV